MRTTSNRIMLTALAVSLLLGPGIGASCAQPVIAGRDLQWNLGALKAGTRSPDANSIACPPSPNCRVPRHSWERAPPV